MGLFDNSGYVNRCATPKIEKARMPHRLHCGKLISLKENQGDIWNSIT